jgi:hypothetical protein
MAEGVLEAARLDHLQVEGGGSVFVTATVGYWRKANQVHRWFVENVQDGVDDCGRYEVTRDQLEELRTKCILVLAASEMVTDNVVVGHRATGATSILDVVRSGGQINEGWAPMLELGLVILDPSVAEAELPAQAGFFYGSTDYDQGYISDLIQTVEILDKVLAVDDEHIDFFYESSW